MLALFQSLSADQAPSSRVAACKFSLECNMKRSGRSSTILSEAPKYASFQAKDIPVDAITEATQLYQARQVRAVTSLQLFEHVQQGVSALRHSCPGFVNCTDPRHVITNSYTHTQWKAAQVTS